MEINESTHTLVKVDEKDINNEGVFIFPQGIKSIGHGAFTNCITLKTIHIPEGVASIKGYAFQFCTALETITIPEGIESMGDCAFSHCTALERITIPEGIKSIGRKSFSYCTALETITIPESLKFIPDYAFEFCTALETITIPDSVKFIGDQVFISCSKLQVAFIQSRNMEKGDRIQNLLESRFWSAGMLNQVEILRSQPLIKSANKTVDSSFFNKEIMTTPNNEPHTTTSDIGEDSTSKAFEMKCLIL